MNKYIKIINIECKRIKHNIKDDRHFLPCLQLSFGYTLIAFGIIIFIVGMLEL